MLLNDSYLLNSVLQTDNVHKQVQVFNEVFKRNLDLCAPVVTREISRPYAPWITADIRTEMNARDDLQRTLKVDRYDYILQV